MWDGIDILERTPPRADKTLPYGSLPLQFGDLWLPAKPPAKGQRWPLLVVLHGGWWRAEYGLGYMSFLCQAMKAQGVAVWSLEYRRVGDAGGGWPGTMQDVALGFDHVAKLAEAFPIDTSRIVAAGHSAGGHLAFWLAGRHHIPASSVLALPQPALKLKGVVALAGAIDLRLVTDLGGLFRFANGPGAVRALMGGSLKDLPERYAAADPGRLLPLNVPQILVQGVDDDQIPAEVPQRWLQQAKRQGDVVEVKTVPNAGHFEIVDPGSAAWPVSRDAMLKLLRS